jgi:hypothetical protein
MVLLLKKGASKKEIEAIEKKLYKKKFLVALMRKNIMGY